MKIEISKILQLGFKYLLNKTTASLLGILIIIALWVLFPPLRSQLEKFFKNESETKIAANSQAIANSTEFKSRTQNLNIGKSAIVHKVSQIDQSKNQIIKNSNINGNIVQIAKIENLTVSQINRSSSENNIQFKIRNLLLDPANEAKGIERWKLLSLITPAEAIGLFNLIKEIDLATVIKDEQGRNLLTTYRSKFFDYRKLSDKIDKHIYSIVEDDFPNASNEYRNKICEYSKLRLLGLNEDNAIKRIYDKRLGYTTPSVENCNKVYKFLLEDSQLKNDLNALLLPKEECLLLLKGIKELKELSS